MLKSLTIVVALATTILSARAGEFSKAEIDALPQESVAAIRKQCEQKWGSDFDMRIFCEDQQFKSLRALINRGSIAPQKD